MSEARPRPRPRPKPRAKASSNDAPESSAAATLSAAQIKDEDALFMRNTTRTSKAWRQLDQLDKAASTKPLRIADSDSDGPGGSPRKSRKRKSNEKDGAIPRWEQDKDILRFLSKEPDSRSDDEVEVVAYSPSKGKGIPRKRSRISRSRSRSRSITPPPALPSHQLQNARNVVRQALAGIPRPLSPTGSDIDESTDTIVLDPELASIAKAVQSKSQQRFDRAPSASFLDEELFPHASGTITVRVRWKPHPQNTAAKSQTWAFKMNRDATFHTLFDEVADSAQIRTEKLIVTYNDKRVFASSTPEALEMPLEADLAACDAVTFEYIRKKQTEVAPPVSVTALNIPSDDEPHHQLHPKVTAMLSRPSDDSDNESAASNAGTFKLIVRSRLTGDKEFTLTVRPTTKCGAIVKAFLKRAGLSDQYPTAGEASSVIPPAPTKKKKKGAALPAVKDPRLSIDGDSADNGTEIETFDLDDGDQVEVVGL